MLETRSFFFCSSCCFAPFCFFFFFVDGCERCETGKGRGKQQERDLREQAHKVGGQDAEPIVRVAHEVEDGEVRLVLLRQDAVVDEAEDQVAADAKGHRHQHQLVPALKRSGGKKRTKENRKKGRKRKKLEREKENTPFRAIMY